MLGDMIQPTIRVFRDLQELSEEAAARFVAISRENVELSGRFRVAISGGKTPAGLFGCLKQEPHLSAIPWARCEIYFVDERCVKPNDEQSNFGQAMKLLLDEVDVPYEKVFRMKGELDPQQAANEYDTLLKKAFGDEEGMDLTILGIGADGHTASLFPDTTDWDEKGRLCSATHVKKLGAWRLTQTPGFINRSREIFFLASGAEKAKPVSGVLEQSGKYPAGLIQPNSGKLSWYLDAAAAGMEE